MHLDVAITGVDGEVRLAAALNARRARADAEPPQRSTKASCFVATGRIAVLWAMSDSSVRVVNSGTGQLTLWIEPWGDFVTIGPGATVRVVASSRQEGELEIVWSEADATVYAWPTSSIRLFDEDGAAIKPGAFTQPVPAVPPGASVRDFLKLTLGD